MFTCLDIAVGRRRWQSGVAKLEVRRIAPAFEALKGQADLARSIQRVTRMPTFSQNAAFWQHLPAIQQAFAPKRSTDYPELVEFPSSDKG